jgi:type IV pilus assembly protein PilQ
LAGASQITNVDVQATDGGIELVLSTNVGDRPQVFSSSRQDKWVADLINTQLNLGDTLQFQQENPAPGIAAVEIVPLDTNSVRITVTGTDGVPTGSLSDRDDRELLFNIATDGSAVEDSAAASPSSITTVAQASEDEASDNGTSGNGEVEVLFPDPDISITGATSSLAIPRSGPVPAPLPRAVAPPLGDIAISELRPRVPGIDLGTAVEVPRLVLRDAPAREVLALLARAADMNLAFINSTGGEGAEGAAAFGEEGPTITLDLENEPVQDVFDYVLRLTELEAVLNGRTVLVGPELPPEVLVQNTSVRTLRINQADAVTVAAFLSAQGAETQRVVTQTTRIEEGTGVDRRIREETNTTIQPLAANTSTTGAPLLLQGLSIVTDERLNAVTIIGEPRLVELATSFTRQLDLRQRQVAINVKVVDVTLDNTASLSSSFSFGVDDTFIVSDGGAGLIRFGEFRPAGVAETNASLPNNPVVDNPFSDNETFLDLSSRNINIPEGGIDTISTTATGDLIINGQLINPANPTFQEANGSVFGATAAVSGDPLQAGATDVTDGTATTVTTNVTASTPPVTTTSIAQGTAPTADFALPELFQYPSDFLASVQAQVVSGNAKILTDPTLVVQEGQSASVNLSQQVVTNVTENDGDINNEFTPVGLTLTVAVLRIDDNGFVTVEVQPRITTPVGFQQIQTGRGPFTVIQIGERELNSGRVRLRDGQTLILAGIITETDQETVTKWPLLGDLPILGALFRATNSDRNRSEVIIVVTPQIMDDSQNADFGYNYVPGPEVQELLERGR